MQTIDLIYKKKRTEPSDINELLDILRYYSSQCGHVTECGVRSCVSSWAFLKGLTESQSSEKTLIGVDIEKSDQVAKIEEVAKYVKINYKFIKGNDILVQLEPTDLLFIDTWHVYGHLKRELAAHAHLARKYIIMHDTTVDAVQGETVRVNLLPPHIKIQEKIQTAQQLSKESGYPIEEIEKGLWPAIEEFLSEHSNEWQLHERIMFCNGLTILKRIDPTSTPPAPSPTSLIPTSSTLPTPTPLNPLRHFFDTQPHRIIHKWDHYFDIYHTYFKKFRKSGQHIHMLEVGVSEGGSIEMWRDYFGPDRCTIYGIDITPSCKRMETMYPNVKIFIGDQSNKDFLKSVINQIPPLDIILDDGGHTMTQQIVTFETMYSHIKPGGVYMCEDLHTSYWNEFGGGFKRAGTFIEYIKDYIDKLNSYHSRQPNLKVDSFTKTMDSLHFYDSIAVLQKSLTEKAAPFWLKK